MEDCRREVETTGYMFEYFEHKSVNSNFAQGPINIKAVEVSIQTDMSMLHKGPHPTDPNKEIVYDKIPPITERRRVWDPNLVCERFIHQEARNIYNNRVQLITITIRHVSNLTRVSNRDSNYFISVCMTTVFH